MLAVPKYPPARAFAVRVGAVATPEALVTAITDVWLPGNVPLGPFEGTENVTATPLTTLLVESLTVACKAVPKFVLSSALCGVPAEAEMKTGVPGNGNGTSVAPVGCQVEAWSVLLKTPPPLSPA